jgi:RNA polymerase sigma-70 factor (ECF subfamily)
MHGMTKVPTILIAPGTAKAGKEFHDYSISLSNTYLRAVTRVPAKADADHVMMRRVTKGDLAAFEVLVEKYKQPIITFANRVLSDPAEAQDVAQNVFVQVFKKSARFRYTCKFSTWLYIIARNLCRNELRRRYRQRIDSLHNNGSECSEHAHLHFEGSSCGNGPEAVFQGELHQKIEQALGDLPEPQRTAILLLRDKDLSYGEIAAILGTSLPATKSLIHRSRQTLKRKLRPYLRTGAWPAERKRANALLVGHPEPE